MLYSADRRRRFLLLCYYNHGLSSSWLNGLLQALGGNLTEASQHVLVHGNYEAYASGSTAKFPLLLPDFTDAMTLQNDCCWTS